MAFVKRAGIEEYGESLANIVQSIDVKGMIFFDDIDRTMAIGPDREIHIIQYIGSLGCVL